MVSALEPVGLMRRVGLAQTLRMALSGNDERVTAETALRIGLVTEIVERDRLWDRAHEMAAGIAGRPSAATQGTVRAIWESLDRPYRAAMEQGLIYTRLGNPLGMAEVAEHPPVGRTRAEAALMPDVADRRAGWLHGSPTSWPSTRVRRRWSSRARGGAGASWPTPWRRRASWWTGPAPRSACSCATGRPRSGCSSGSCAPAAAS